MKTTNKNFSTILVLLFMMVCVSACSRQASSRGPAMDREVNVSILHLHGDQAGQESDKVGRLYFVGGVELKSPDNRFGGFSGMAISPGGDKLWLVNDKGNWLSAGLSLDESGLPRSLSHVKMQPLLQPDGAFARGKAQGDAEELAIAPDGSMVVAFERRHRLLVYPRARNPLAGTPKLLKLPPWLVNQGANRGAEAMTYLADGRLLVVAEGGGGKETPAAIWDGSSWSRLRYACVPGLRPTAAALLPDGGVVLLERGFSPPAGLSVRVVRVGQEQIHASALLKPEVLADLSASMPTMIDNFEALAIRPSSRGAFLYILSDDNFYAFQRTLLLLFDLELDR